MKTQEKSGYKYVVLAVCTPERDTGYLTAYSKERHTNITDAFDECLIADRGNSNDDIEYIVAVDRWEGSDINEVY